MQLLLIASSRIASYKQLYEAVQQGLVLHLMLGFLSLFQICTHGFACAFFCYDIFSDVHRVYGSIVY